MKISVKKYNNDVSKAYRIMMRKLNAEGFYNDLRKKDHYISKSQQIREDKKVGTKRYKRSEAKRLALLEKLENKTINSKPYKKPSNKEQ